MLHYERAAGSYNRPVCPDSSSKHLQKVHTRPISKSNHVRNILTSLLSNLLSYSTKMFFVIITDNSYLQ